MCVFCVCVILSHAIFVVFLFENFLQNADTHFIYQISLKSWWSIIQRFFKYWMQFLPIRNEIGENLKQRKFRHFYSNIFDSKILVVTKLKIKYMHVYRKIERIVMKFGKVIFIFKRNFKSTQSKWNMTNHFQYFTLWTTHTKLKSDIHYSLAITVPINITVVIRPVVETVNTKQCSYLQLMYSTLYLDVHQNCSLWFGTRNWTETDNNLFIIVIFKSHYLF